MEVSSAHFEYIFDCMGVGVNKQLLHPTPFQLHTKKNGTCIYLFNLFAYCLVYC